MALCTEAKALSMSHASSYTRSTFNQSLHDPQSVSKAPAATHACSTFNSERHDNEGKEMLTC